MRTMSLPLSIHQEYGQPKGLGFLLQNLCTNTVSNVLISELEGNRLSHAVLPFYYVYGKTLLILTSRLAALLSLTIALPFPMQG